MGVHYSVRLYYSEALVKRIILRRPQLIKITTPQYPNPSLPEIFCVLASAESIVVSNSIYIVLKSDFEI